MSFDDIPEDKQESYQCPDCLKGNVTLNKTGAWECDACDFCRWDYSAYSQWARDIAKQYTIEEIIKERNKADGNREKLSMSHMNSVEKTSSMTSCSQRRAQSKASMVVNYERMRAYEDAAEIYKYYPDKTKERNYDINGYFTG